MLSPLLNYSGRIKIIRTDTVRLLELNNSNVSETSQGECYNKHHYLFDSFCLFEEAIKIIEIIYVENTSILLTMHFDHGCSASAGYFTPLDVLADFFALISFTIVKRSNCVTFYRFLETNTETSVAYSTIRHFHKRPKLAKMA